MEQIVFFERELNGLAAHIDFVFFVVDRDLGDGDHRRQDVARMFAEIGVDARDQLLHPERLGDVVVRAEIETVDLCLFVAFRACDDDRDVRRRVGTFEYAQRRKPVHPGQHDVEDDQIAVSVFKRFEHALRVRKTIYVELRRVQRHLVQIANARVVFDHKNDFLHTSLSPLLLSL